MLLITHPAPWAGSFTPSSQRLPAAFLPSHTFTGDPNCAFMYEIISSALIV
jgi:hypothetical protein